MDIYELFNIARITIERLSYDREKWRVFPMWSEYGKEIRLVVDMNHPHPGTTVFSTGEDVINKEYLLRKPHELQAYMQNMLYYIIKTIEELPPPKIVNGELATEE